MSRTLFRYKYLKSKLLSICISFTLLCNAQGEKTANDIVPEYSAPFTFGTNLGYVSSGKWNDGATGNLAAGNEQLGIEGVGANSLRLSLPEHFLEKWGYTIRVNTYKEYARLGMSEFTAFIGYPSTEHLDTASYGASAGSKLFANMYEPIWADNGDSVPVNKNNYLALYVYKMVLTYGDKVKFWEVWNEPDYTSSSAAYQPEGTANSWWTRNPTPSELSNLNAPIFHYIRVLRICYEVIKYLQPDDFVCLGGIGYSSFLDALLRNTDNPSDGSVANDYPLKTGAYFDCVSYHAYPMYSLRKWNNSIKGFDYFRHSDEAVFAVVNKKAEFSRILHRYGYNDTLYPLKKYIITETNVPSIAIDEYIGSEWAQNNFLMKLIVAAQKADIKSVHTYCLYDGKPTASVSSSYDAMGFYYNLDAVLPYNQVEKTAAVATRNIMQFLKGSSYDAQQTAELNLPNTVDGAAFKQSSGEYVFVLWAKTTIDKSEVSNTTYSFPTTLKIKALKKRYWNYSETGIEDIVSATNLSLTATPVLVTPHQGIVEVLELQPEKQISVYPNPTSDNVFINIEGELPSEIQLKSIDGVLLQRHTSITGNNAINTASLKGGIYIISLVFADRVIEEKILKQN